MISVFSALFHLTFLLSLLAFSEFLSSDSLFLSFSTPLVVAQAAQPERSVLGIDQTQELLQCLAMLCYTGLR